MEKFGSSILVVGTIKNGERTLQSEIKKCLKALSNFDRVNFYLVESDSSDKTLQILNELKNTLN